MNRIEDASPTAVADRLARIEALLEQQSQQLRHLSTSSTPTNASVVPFDYNQSPLFPQVSEFAEIPSFPQENTIESPAFLIPKGHTTLTTMLLSVPQVRDQLGDYPRDYFYKIEENQALPGTLQTSQSGRKTWPPLRQNILNRLSENYFRNVHPHHPLFSPGTFHVWQTKLIKKEPMENAEAAICLCVYALGAITTPIASTPDASDEALGLGYFRPALAMAIHEYTWNFKPDLAVCQALLLAGSYLSHLGRPVHSWRMVYFASQRFLQSMELRRGEDFFSECNEEELRVFWQCFLVDCNKAEDLDVLRSGIEPLGDKMPLPHSLDSSDHEETIHLFAEISIRRLLNRVQCSLYNPDTEISPSGAMSPAGAWQGLSLQKLLILSSELDRQLEQCARHIIHRPFVLYAVAQQHRASSGQISPGSSVAHVAEVSLPQVVMEKCETCIDSCATYLYNTIEMLDRRSPYLWSYSQSCLACFLVLMLAESCPPLRKFVPPMGPLQDTVVSKLEKWTVEGSSFAAVVAILQRLAFRKTGSA
ncbi:hypothetical protein SCUP234_00585 [Seiridium cupressi]